MRPPLPWTRLFEGAAGIGASRLMGRAADLPLPAPVLRPLIQAYASWFGVDMGAALTPPGGFGSFGAFFARRLRAGARPVDGAPAAVVSPCDGLLLEAGHISESDPSWSVTVKGARYGLAELIGDGATAQALAGGGYCVLYLHPRDYHRVHVPFDARCVICPARGTRWRPGPRSSRSGSSARTNGSRSISRSRARVPGAWC